MDVVGLDPRNQNISATWFTGSEIAFRDESHLYISNDVQFATHLAIEFPGFRGPPGTISALLIRLTNQLSLNFLVIITRRGILCGIG
jgi:hypothetical protein